MTSSFEKNNFAKKLLYNSNNRGLRENELILGSFAASHLNEMTLAELKEYEIILMQNDIDLYEWLTRKSKPAEEFNSSIMQKLLKFNINN